MMEIRQLQTFIAIVEHGGFTKAAEFLGYAQSTVTSHIRILEDELGEVLFERLGKKTILTNFGKQLVPYSKQMLNVYKDIKNMPSEQKEISGEIVIGASESLSIYRLGKMFKEYKKQFPKVNIILKNSICSDLRKRLYTGEFDIVFTIEPEVSDKDLVIKNLKNETMVIIAEPSADLEFLMEYSKDKESKETIIFSEKGCSLRMSFENYLKREKIKYRNPLEFSSIEVAKKCAMNGLGIAAVPFYIVESEINEGALKMIELSDEFDKYCTQMSFHKNKIMSLALSNLIEVVLKASSKW